MQSNNKVTAFPAPTSALLSKPLCRKGFKGKSILTAYSKKPPFSLENGGFPFEKVATFFW